MPNPWLRALLVAALLLALLVAALLLALLVGGYGTYLANQAGRLPWQEDPTRIPVVPFGGLDVPGVDVPAASPTPWPESAVGSG